MKARLLPWAAVLALSVINASCSGQSASESESAVDSGAANTAGLPQSEADMRTGPVAGVPVISARTYVDGSATVKVTGSFAIDEAIPINKPASYSDGSMTWLQYGVSGAETPNILVTVSEVEVGIIVGHGKPTATAEVAACKGGMEVGANTISGHYTCPGITSYDPSNSQMGKVDIEVSLTAKSP